MRLDQNGAQEFLGTILGELIFHINVLKANMKGVTPETYAQDRLVRDALSMRLQEIGEPVRRITGRNTDEFGLEETFPDLPWGDCKECETFWRIIMRTLKYPVPGRPGPKHCLSWRKLSVSSAPATPD